MSAVLIGITVLCCFCSLFLGVIGGGGYWWYSDFREGDLVKYDWTIPDDASDFCPPSTRKLTAMGEIITISDTIIGIEWKYINNPGPGETHDPSNCCWERSSSDANFNLKYFGYSNKNPTARGAPPSQFNIEQAKEHLSKVIIPYTVPTCD